MLSQAQTEKLIELVSELLANDEQFSAALPAQPVAKEMLRPGIGLAELLRVVSEGYADRPALGRRATELVTMGGRTLRRHLPYFETVSYGELWKRATSIAAALHADGVRSGDRIATMGAPSIDYTAADMAVALLGGVSVPLHAGSPSRRLQPIVAEIEPTVIVTANTYLDEAMTLSLESPSVRRLLVIDHDNTLDNHRDAMQVAVARTDRAGAKVVVEAVDDTADRGRLLDPPPLPSPSSERLATVIYTSGSSGSPKGAMQPERLAIGYWTVIAATFVERGFALPAITINYLPMSHTGGRAMLYSTLGAGGTAYFASSTDLSTILEDIALVRPTQLNFIPRVWELLHAEYRARLARSAASPEETLADMRKNVLGGRYISALTGSAPISRDLAAWVEELLDSHLMDALGATESGSVVIDGKIQCPPVSDHRLEDVPELGYFSTDKPHPRGELLIKSSTLFQGYYRRDDLTAEVFDDEGYYRTGDVVALVGPDEVRFLDRRNNVLKLSQGEFVTISKLEALYEKCEPVEQIFVYGNSERAYLLAVVVPTEAAVEQHGDDVRTAILRSLQDAASAAGLELYEVPRDVVVEYQAFTFEAGLLTAVGKLARRELKERYAGALDSLYEEHDRARDAEWHSLRERAPLQPVVDTVCEAAAIAVGRDVVPSPEEHFVDVGGDSLAALSFTSMLTDLLGTEVAVGVVISPANDLRAVAAHIEALRSTDWAQPTFASVHGADATEVAAADLTLDRFIDQPTLAAARLLPGPVSHPRHVLLTGATGYLGRYLLLELLQRAASIGGTVTCLVRAANDDDARRRLHAAFDSGDPTLLDTYRSRATDRLEVVAADKSEFRLGVEHDSWSRLADEIELIVDPAALVNHMLPYPQLFGPNVVGTAELIRLALTTRQKPIVHVSSVAAGLTASPGELTEDADIRTMCPTKPVDDAYASGYATSKWAGEVLLREANDLCGIPVRVFRCDMLMAEPTYRGQLKVTDMVTRLLFSVAVTGLAPASFYSPGRDGGRARTHFDGLPVDFVAKAITDFGTDIAPDLRTYHVVNPHDDGIGLDEYVDWMIEAGRAIERIEDHEDWFRRFQSALRNLPERSRQASLLPIVETFRHRQPPVTGSFAPATRFAAAVAAHGIGDGRIPGIDRPIIEKYLADLQHLGLL